MVVLLLLSNFCTGVTGIGRATSSSLEAIGNQSSGGLADQEILRRLSSSVSSALDDAADALSRIKAHSAGNLTLSVPGGGASSQSGAMSHDSSTVASNHYQLPLLSASCSVPHGLNAASNSNAFGSLAAAFQGLLICRGLKIWLPF